MQTLLIIFILVNTGLQATVLVFWWKHRHDASLLIPEEQREKLFADILKVQNYVRTIHSFSDLLLKKSYGKLNFSQQEFVHQVNEACLGTKKVIDDLLGEGKVLSSDINLSSRAGEEKDTFKPPSHSILAHIHIPSEVSEETRQTNDT